MKDARCYISDNQSTVLSAGTNSSLNATSSGGEAVAAGFTGTTTSFDPDSIAVGLATEIAANEIAHVKFLRAALTEAGATAVCMAYLV